MTTPESRLLRFAAVLVTGILAGALLGAGVAYVAFSPPTATPLAIPVASFGASTPMPFGVRTHLKSISSDLPVRDFYLRLRTDSAWSQAVTIPENITTGAYALFNVWDHYFAIFYRDAAPRGILDVHDEFLIAPMHGIPCPTQTMYLDLLWNASYAVTNDGRLDWACSARFSLTLGLASPMGNAANGTSLPVDSAPEETLPMNLLAQLEVNSSVGGLGWVAMGNGTRMIVPGSMVSLAVGWDDRDRSGTVNVGDRFTVIASARMGPGIHIALFLFDRNGTFVASASWIS